MAKKKKSKAKKTAKKKIIKKVSRKTTKKVKKKVIKKAAKRSPKKIGKKPVEKRSRKGSTRRGSTKSSFPTMDVDESREGLFSPSSAGTYDEASMGKSGHSEDEDGVSSRRLIIIGVLVLIGVVAMFVIGRGIFAPSGDKTDSVTVLDSKTGSAKGRTEKGSTEAVIKKSEKTTEISGERFYTVQKGDTLSSIARKILGKASRWKEIMKLNKLKGPSSAKPGKVLKMPPKK